MKVLATRMKASLFVAICPYSSLLFVTATANEKMDNWISCHVKALDCKIGCRTLPSWRVR